MGCGDDVEGSDEKGRKSLCARAGRTATDLDGDEVDQIVAKLAVRHTTVLFAHSSCTLRYASTEMDLSS